ncbi:MAG: hypothetical protein NC918_08290 [Candidatus Omnitrophica bacterium]|nr:hypothetical protein [Candidatus Omnitrophota bacterium]
MNISVEGNINKVLDERLEKNPFRIEEILVADRFYIKYTETVEHKNVTVQVNVLDLKTKIDAELTKKNFGGLKNKLQYTVSYSNIDPESSLRFLKESKYVIDKVNNEELKYLERTYHKLGVVLLCFDDAFVFIEM